MNDELKLDSYVCVFLCVYKSNKVYWRDDYDDDNLYKHHHLSTKIHIKYIMVCFCNFYYANLMGLFYA